MPIEGRIDLHGLTQHDAYMALRGFIAGARIFPAGKNTTDSITPVIAVNIVH